MGKENSSSSLPGQLGKWQIKKRLASRLDKIVLLGEHKGEFAAIKILKNADLLDDSERNRFDQEILNLQKLDHPAIPKIIDIELSNAVQPWMATEFIPGLTLQEYVSKHRGLTLQEWVRALKEITAALAYIHSQGIYHRDISPSNIILSKEGAKLIDFGMAYLEDSQTLTKSGLNVGGTPTTVSPESLSFKKDPKMDMFSLGSTFVFAGSGNYPFPPEDTNETNWMQSILYSTPNFYDLNQDQIRLLQPLLYKDLFDRVSSSAYLDILKDIEIVEEKLVTNKPKLEMYLNNAEIKLSRSNLRGVKPKTNRRIVFRIFLLTGFGVPLVLLTFNELSVIRIDLLSVLLFIGLGLVPICGIALGFFSFFRGLGVKKWGKRRIFRSALLAFFGAVSPYLLVVLLALGSILPQGLSSLIQETTLLNSNSANSTSPRVAIPVVAEEFRDTSPKTFEIQTLLDSAEKPFKNANYEKALTILDKAAALGSSEAYSRIGYIRYFSNDELGGKAAMLKATELNYAPAFGSLGLYEFLEGNLKKAIDWWEQGKLRNDTLSMRRLASQYLDPESGLNPNERKKQFLLNMRLAASLNDEIAMYDLAEYFSREETNREEALYWAKESSSRGLNGATVLVGKLYQESKEWELARSYYQKAVDRNDPEGMLYLAKLNASRNGKSREVCKLLEEAKARALLFNDWDIREWAVSDIFIDEKIIKASKDLCAEFTSREASKDKTSSVSAKPSVNTSPSPRKSGAASQPSEITPDPKKGPVLSSDELKVSAPLSKTLKVSDIFGRVFEDSAGYWVITLSNYKEQPVPPITGIQFRLVGFPNADWFHVPYKLKTSLITDSVYAAVDDIFLATLLNRPDICPEFRAVREEKGEIVNIWTKGQPECVNDYKP